MAVNASNHQAARPSRFGPVARFGLSLSLLLALFLGLHLPERGVTGVQDEHVDFIGPQNAFAQAVDGKKLYATRCASCHQPNGDGVAGVFPPLVKSEWVTGDKGQLVRIILQGLQGEIVVNGTTYSGAMPPWGTFLKDEEIAALSTYIRANWGNKAPAVTAAEVAAVREATKTRKQPWTAAELKTNKGIPGAK